MNKTKLHILLRVTFVFYCAILCYFLFFSDYYGRSFTLLHGNYFSELFIYCKQKVNLVPFATVFLFLKGFGRGTVELYPFAINILGNLLAFSPFGFFLPYFFKKLRKPINFLIVVSLIVCLVEILQLVFMTGVCDIDDLLLNVSGAFIVYLIVNKFM